MGKITVIENRFLLRIKYKMTQENIFLNILGMQNKFFISSYPFEKRRNYRLSYQGSLAWHCPYV